MLPLAGKPARKRPSDSIDGSIDGEVKIALGIVDGNLGSTVHGNPDLAALVLAAAWAVDVGQADDNPADVVLRPVEREVQAPLDMFAQSCA